MMFVDFVHNLHSEILHSVRHRAHSLFTSPCLQRYLQDYGCLSPMCHNKQNDYSHLHLLGILHSVRHRAHSLFTSPCLQRYLQDYGCLSPMCYNKQNDYSHLHLL
ncbi:hypothetical protein J6590_069269 [Homalodisca vitripennis]|nr:hypothetical protein J6590_069269 [Homalodisca vitripennis]